MKRNNKLWMSIKKAAKLEYLIDMKNRIDRRIDAFPEYE